MGMTRVMGAVGIALAISAALHRKPTAPAPTSLPIALGEGDGSHVRDRADEANATLLRQMAENGGGTVPMVRGGQVEVATVPDDAAAPPPPAVVPGQPMLDAAPSLDPTPATDRPRVAPALATGPTLP